MINKWKIIAKIISYLIMIVSRSFDNKVKRKRILIFFLIIVFIYPFLLIWQGGDLTDSGYWAFRYASFFKNILKGQINSLSFFTDFLGALWLKLLPNGEIIGFRVLFAIFTMAIAFTTYKMLNELIKNKIILTIGIFCGITFGIRFTSIFFAQDIASTFFLMLMSYFLIKHFELNRVSYIFLSGIMFFFSFITRFPNIVFFAFLPIILSYHYFYKLDEKKTILKIKNVVSRYTFFCLGFFLLYGIFFGILSFNGIWDFYIEDLSKSFSNQNSSYSFFNLLMSYYRDIINFYPHLIIVSLLMLFLSLLSENTKSKKNRIYLLIPLVLLFLASILIYGGFSYKSNIKYFIPAFCALPLFLSIISKDKFSDAAIILISIAVTQIAGTNTGFFLKLSYGFIGLIPLSLIILYKLKVIYFWNLKMPTKPIFFVGIFFILFLSLWSTIGTVYHIDRGLRSRFRCIHPIEHQKMKGIITTDTNADFIKRLTESIENNIKKNNTLFIYGNVPMLYYLTEKEPSINKIWLADGAVQVDELFSELERSITKEKHPMIVDIKSNIMGKDGEIGLNDFLRKFDYYKLESNILFTIWKTNPN